MTNRNQKLLWAALAVAVVLGLLWQFYPLPDAQNRVQSLPKSGNGYTSHELTVAESSRAVFGEAQVLLRGYEVGGQRVFVWVIDGSRNRHAVHDPLYCIRGDGWKVISQTPFPLDGGTANLIRLAKDGHETESLVWFSDGHTRHASAPRYWWQTTLRRLTLGVSGPEPVLINVSAYGTNATNWRQLMEQFPALFKL